MLTLAILLMSIIPNEAGILRDQVDLIELNSFYDERGALVFQQVIFYDWSESDARYNVRAWRLVKHECQIPRPDC